MPHSVLAHMGYNLSSQYLLDPLPPRLPLALPIVLHFGGQSKVANLDPHVVIEEEVPQLDVTVDDVPSMEVVHSQQGLLHQVADLRLRQGLAPFVQLHQ